MRQAHRMNQWRGFSLSLRLAFLRLRDLVSNLSSKCELKGGDYHGNKFRDAGCGSVGEQISYKINAGKVHDKLTFSYRFDCNMRNGAPWVVSTSGRHWKQTVIAATVLKNIKHHTISLRFWALSHQKLYISRCWWSYPRDESEQHANSGLC